MAILTFTSDFGLRDYYVAAVKGAILTQLPDARIVDISHDVQAFNIQEAAYLVKSAYKYFPKGTVHMIGVKAEADAEVTHRIVSYDGHYFVGADTGIFSLIFTKAPDAVYDLNIPSESDVLTFPVLHVFVNAVCHLMRGGTPEVIARKSTSRLRDRHTGKVFFDGDTIKGHIIHVDRYDNLITDISKSLYKEVSRGRAGVINLRTRRNDVKKVSERYSDVNPGDPVAIFNTNGLLEIAINDGAPGVGGGAAQLVGLHTGDLIMIVFESSERPPLNAPVAILGSEKQA